MIRSALMILVVLTSTVVANPPDPKVILKDLNVVIPVTVELQGKVRNLSDQKLEQLYFLVAEALKWTRELSPPSEPNNLFSWKSDSRGLLRNRTLTFILTDSDVISYRGQEFPVGEGFDAFTFAPILTDNQTRPEREDIHIVLRVDKLAYDKSKELRSDANLNILNGLLVQVYAFIQEHLLTSLTELTRIGSKNPHLLDERVTRRAINLFDSLLSDSRVPTKPNPGRLQAAFYKGLSDQLDKLEMMTRSHQGPFVIPHVQTWGPRTLSAMKSDVKDEALLTANWALHLVRALPPEGLMDHIYSCPPGKRHLLKNKMMRLIFSDSRDKDVRNSLIATVVDRIDWLPSEGFVMRNPKDDSVLFDVVVWTNHVLHDASRNLRQDRLARTAVALASEFYGGVQEYLTKPPQAIMSDQNPLELVNFRTRVLQQGVDFVDRLTSDETLWNTIPMEQQRDFFKVRAEYEKQVKLHHTCSQALRGRGPADPRMN